MKGSTDKSYPRDLMAYSGILIIVCVMKLFRNNLLISATAIDAQFTTVMQMSPLGL